MQFTLTLTSNQDTALAAHVEALNKTLASNGGAAITANDYLTNQVTELLAILEKRYLRSQAEKLAEKFTQLDSSKQAQVLSLAGVT